ncbi:MAG: Ada metal-binding domain-containing protein [Actinomycetales bacterium]
MALQPCYNVATTIVCRMGCASRTPRPENAVYSSNLSPASYLTRVHRV